MQKRQIPAYMHQFKYSRVCFFIPFVLAFSTCTLINPPKPDPGNADLKKTIAVGGNYLSGYQDGALDYNGQSKSIPELITQEFQEALAAQGFGTTIQVFKQPLMPFGLSLGLNNKKWESDFVTKSSLSFRIDCKGAKSLSPVKNIISLAGQSASLFMLNDSNFHNLAVPYAGIKDFFNPSFGKGYYEGNTNPYYNRFAASPGNSTVFSDAASSGATFLIIWTGMEDIYNYAGAGGFQKAIPQYSEFSAYLDSLLKNLTASGAKGVIANIPDIYSFPFYTLIPVNGLDLAQSTADSLNMIWQASGITHVNFKMGKNYFIMEDSLAPYGFRHTRESDLVLLSIPLDSVKCFLYGSLIGTFANRYVLDSVEITTVQQAINDYNQVIRQKADQYNFAHADIHAYFRSVKNGLKVNGENFNLDFISGGFISLDGYHPTQKGYAIIANEFILAINAKYKAKIPRVNCKDCSGILFP